MLELPWFWGVPFPVLPIWQSCRTQKSAGLEAESEEKKIEIMHKSISFEKKKIPRTETNELRMIDWFLPSSTDMQLNKHRFSSED